MKPCFIDTSEFCQLKFIASAKEEFSNTLCCRTYAVSSVPLWATFHLHLISLSFECLFDSK
jgi:hypothetical protein